jgi:hypothetical protein
MSRGKALVAGTAPELEYQPFEFRLEPLKLSVQKPKVPAPPYVENPR